MSLKTIDSQNVSYYALNNQINIPVDGQIPLNKDQEALQAFLAENVKPNTKTFPSFKARLDYLLEHNYLESDFISKYSLTFMEALHDELAAQIAIVS